MKTNRIIILATFFCLLIFESFAVAEDFNNRTAMNCSYSNISIHSIQGAGHKSPIAGCYVSEVRGIVTLSTSSGFYMQEPNPDSDSRTSEGILVYTKPKNVKKGDLVSVNGTVSEFQGKPLNPNILSLTEIINPKYSIISHNNTVTPVILGKGGLVPPDTVIEDDAYGDIAINNTFDPETDAIDFYESLENMLVKINDAVIVQPASPDKYRIVTVSALGDNGSLASIRTPSGGIVVRPGDFNPERIMIDFSADSTEPINVGDRIQGPIVGAMGYANKNYMIIVDKGMPLKVVHNNSAKVVESTKVTIATFNVESLKPSSTKFKMLAEQIVNNIGAPDIIALEEIMGDGSAKDGSDIYKTLNTLIQNIKTVSNGMVQYSNISIPDNNSDRNIAILYRIDGNLSFKSVSVGNPRSNVSIISGPHLFPNPGWVYPKSKAFDRSRKPLAAEFTMKGLNQSLFVIANHLKSKVEDLPLYGEVQPPRLVTANKRHTQAQIVKSFVDELLNVDPSANLVVLGDLNDFQFSETLHILKGNLLFNPLENLPIGEQYNYNFEGNSQAIDHILISKNLLNMSPELDVVHINSDFANKTSDHDPVALKIRVPMAYNQKLT